MSGKLLKKYSAVEGGFSYVGAVAAFLVVTVIYSFAVGALEEGSAVYEVVSFLFNILIQVVQISLIIHIIIHLTYCRRELFISHVL